MKTRYILPLMLLVATPALSQTYTPPSVQNGQVVNAGPTPQQTSIPTSVPVGPNTRVGVGSVPDAGAPGAQTSEGTTTGSAPAITVQTTP
ncbi:MAG TPA: hypothetical protein VIM02_03815 [Rhizomicrobium sp.]|jgi:hypothetical protein